MTPMAGPEPRRADGMVFTSAVRGGWSRRAVLGAAGGAGIAKLVAGCSAFDREEPPAPPDPLEPLLASTRALVARYEEALAIHPELAERLGTLREALLAHEAALIEAIDQPDLTIPSPSGGAWSPPITDGTEPAEEVLAGLRDAEAAGRDEAVEACLSAPAERAALLGSIAAARATHLEVLA